MMTSPLTSFNINVLVSLFKLTGLVKFCIYIFGYHTPYKMGTLT